MFFNSIQLNRERGLPIHVLAAHLPGSGATPQERKRSVVTDLACARNSLFEVI